MSIKLLSFKHVFKILWWNHDDRYILRKMCQRITDNWNYDISFYNYYYNMQCRYTVAKHGNTSWACVNFLLLLCMTQYRWLAKQRFNTEIQLLPDIAPSSYGAVSLLNSTKSIFNPTVKIRRIPLDAPTVSQQTIYSVGVKSDHWSPRVPINWPFKPWRHIWENTSVDLETGWSVLAFRQDLTACSLLSWEHLSKLVIGRTNIWVIGHVWTQQTKSWHSCVLHWQHNAS